VWQDSRVVGLACGARHVALLLEGGALRVAGGGPGSLSPDGALPALKRLQEELGAGLVEADLGGEAAVELFAGTGWTFARTSAGHLWGWGEAAAGGLLGLAENSTVPKRVYCIADGRPAPAFSHLSCAARLDSLWAVDAAEGRLYAAGIGGPLAAASARLLTPRLVPPEPVRVLLAHATAPLALLADGSVLTLADMRRLPLCAGIACIVRDRHNENLVRFHSLDERMLQIRPEKLRQLGVWLGRDEV